MKPEVIIRLECLGIKGVVVHESDDGLLYCDARSDDGIDHIVASAETFDELVDSFRVVATDYFNQHNVWLKSFD